MADTQIQIQNEQIEPEPVIKVSQGRAPQESYFTKSIKKLTHALFRIIFQKLKFFSVSSK